jgi:cytochrome c oxidase subunit 2
MNDVIKQVDAAFLYIIVFSLGLLLLVTAVMIYFLIRYREKKNPRPTDIRGNLFLELTWMIIPSIIALSMFYFGWQSFLGLRGVPKDAIEIDATGMQFAWVFKYPNGKESEGLLMAPEGAAVKLNLTSLDVIHGFYLPAFRIKMDAINNMKTYAWFRATPAGNYTIFCTQYCGLGHADMTALLRVVPEPEYRAWIQK